MKKKVLAVLLSSLMTIGLMTGCSSEAKNTSVESAPTKAAGTEEAAGNTATDSGATATDGQWEYKRCSSKMLPIW